MEHLSMVRRGTHIFCGGKVKTPRLPCNHQISRRLSNSETEVCPNQDVSHLQTGLNITTEPQPERRIFQSADAEYSFWANVASSLALQQYRGLGRHQSRWSLAASRIPA